MKKKKKKKKKKQHFLIYMKMTWAHNKDAYWSTLFGFFFFFIKILSGSFHMICFKSLLRIPLFFLHFIDITVLINKELTSFLIGFETYCKKLNLLLPGCSHLYRFTNTQVSYGLCCQNTIEQVSDNIQRINRINVSQSVVYRETMTESTTLRVILQN